MRVAQKIAGYSLAEADLLRKAMGKKNRELIADRAGQVRRRRRAHRLRRRPRHPPVRHHRAVRRLRLQQEPRLRLRARRLPDGVPEGALPGRVPGLPADQRQEQPREGRRLHQRVPGDGHPRAPARHQSLGHRLRRAGPRRGARRRDAAARQPRRDHVRAVGRAQRRRRARRPVARRARRQRPVRQLPRLRRAGARAGAQQAGRRVADQGRCLRQPRPPAQGPARRVRARHRHDADPPSRARPGRDEPVRRLGRGRRRAAVRRAHAGPRRRVRQGRQAAQREGDARAVRVGPSAVRRRGGAATQGRALRRRPRRKWPTAPPCTSAASSPACPASSPARATRWPSSCSRISRPASR